jgi:sigma-54 dependent transcriptional regulator, flagellar regulatory protein
MGQDGVERRKVLVVDTNPSRAEALSQRLRFLDYQPVLAGDDSSMSDTIAVLVGDLGKGDNGDAGSERSFSDLISRKPDLPVIVVSAGQHVFRKAEDRPTWFLDSPIRRSQLKQLLVRASRYRCTERRQRLTGNSLPIRAVRQLIEQVAGFDTNVLITGESGTGKELVARTTHDLSDRRDRPFVPINCGAIPADLLESELFGHEKGAFSGAVSARTGRFELAEGGTLFLDEVGDMSLPMQVKLLRVLQERTFERVGSNQPRPCNVRIIAATHRDLPTAVAKGDFREDLFYRLNVFPIEMPPLCKRLGDLPLLLEELLFQHQGGRKTDLRVSPAALGALASYPWPGNIRELSNLVERLAILHPSGEIGLADLPQKYRHSAPTAEAVAMATIAAEPPSDLKAHLRSIEQTLIRQAMQEAEGVVANAARLLKMRRTTLVEKLGKYAIA